MKNLHFLLELYKGRLAPGIYFFIGSDDGSITVKHKDYLWPELAQRHGVAFGFYEKGFPPESLTQGNFIAPNHKDYPFTGTVEYTSPHFRQTLEDFLKKELPYLFNQKTGQRGVIHIAGMVSILILIAALVYFFGGRPVSEETKKVNAGALSVNIPAIVQNTDTETVRKAAYTLIDLSGQVAKLKVDILLAAWGKMSEDQKKETLLSLSKSAADITKVIQDNPELKSGLSGLIGGLQDVKQPTTSP